MSYIVAVFQFRTSFSGPLSHCSQSSPQPMSTVQRNVRQILAACTINKVLTSGMSSPTSPAPLMKRGSANADIF